MSRTAKRKAKIWNNYIVPAIEIVFGVLFGVGMFALLVIAAILIF